MLNLSPTEAGTRVTHATQLAPRRALTGASLPALLPNTAAALAAGKIGPAQVRVITETMSAVPADVTPTTVTPPKRNWLAMPGRSIPRRYTGSVSTSWRILIRTVPSPVTSRNRPRLRGSCGCGTAATGESGWRDTSKLSTEPRSDH